MHSCGDYPEVGHTIAECCKEKEHSYLEYCIADKGEECGDILPCCKAEQPAERTAQNYRDKCECDIAACGGIDEEREHFHWIGDACDCEQGGDDDCAEGNEAFFSYGEFTVDIFDEF